jgi:hypothetical protein
MFPGCGSAWKNPISKHWRNTASDGDRDDVAALIVGERVALGIGESRIPSMRSMQRTPLLECSG